MIVQGLRPRIRHRCCLARGISDIPSRALQRLNEVLLLPVLLSVKDRLSMTNAHVQLSVSRRRILEAWGSSSGEKIALRLSQDLERLSGRG